MKFTYEKYFDQTMKFTYEKYFDQTMKFTYPVVERTPIYPWICLHHTFAARNLILGFLTGSHWSKLEACVNES